VKMDKIVILRPVVAVVDLGNGILELSFEHLKEKKDRLDVPQHFIDNIEQKVKA
jgi:hypothetical protein